ncbi:hypothetical protein CDES_10570 [Corynebacterium deserti GIMN1.010]|uniref:Uncharacterized protein n=1 Tax=Corynebacterium deserti GIMN1.010 TaxID=931089 RepID=A0A0M3Q9X2_9CORY|nr:hypothetical protein CDES_10570 [Corynebacterium deserti GIMN1.010]
MAVDLHNRTTTLDFEMALYFVFFFGALTVTSAFPQHLKRVSAVVAIIGVSVLYGLTRIFRPGKQPQGLSHGVFSDSGSFGYLAASVSAIFLHNMASAVHSMRCASNGLERIAEFGAR